MKKNNGFTIVELAIVIAVVAILAAVLLPTFSHIIEKAQQTTCLQEAKSVFNELYALDFSDGKIDGIENGAAFVDTDGTILLNGYDNCKYMYADRTFEYTNGKYKCTAKLSMTDTANTWEIVPA